MGCGRLAALVQPHVNMGGSLRSEGARSVLTSNAEMSKNSNQGKHVDVGITVILIEWYKIWK